MSQPEVAAAVAGFNYFGLADAALVFQQLPDGTEETEERLNQLYVAAVPNDETLAHAFRVKLFASPEAFAPMDSGAHA
ncbi:hypothetical protein FQY83_13895 [Luteimonas marina]|uniref:Uncharacterized protein n=1 Tax=Luteimonas marina TaxID=488485 RepID=A0A5C5TZE9_9GAMM|nr:hypothetical protein [Luteimonas marina]TWT19433.1 hypothetical protein FQY83_13895 [Luteimonas marina]